MVIAWEVATPIVGCVGSKGFCVVGWETQANTGLLGGVELDVTSNQWHMSICVGVGFEF